MSLKDGPHKAFPCQVYDPGGGMIVEATLTVGCEKPDALVQKVFAEELSNMLEIIKERLEPQ